MFKTTLVLAAWILSGAQAHAGAIHETWVVHGTPTAQAIQKWKKLAPSVNYIIQLDGTASFNLEPLAEMHAGDRVQVESPAFPKVQQIEQWKKLAARGFDFIGYNIGYPDASQAQLLNDIGFKNIILLNMAYPSVEQAQGLGALQAKVSLNFITRVYPRFNEREQFDAIPAPVTSYFASDYWPTYSAMDMFNILKRPVHLRVSGIYPTDKHFEYLLNIHDLVDVGVTADYEPATELWEKFGALPVKWTAKGMVPTVRALQAYAQSAHDGRSRKFVIDTDQEFTAQELARLQSFALPVEWVHSVSNDALH